MTTEIIGAISVLVAVGVLAVSVTGLVLNMLKDRIKKLEEDVDVFRKRFHEFNNNTSTVLTDMSNNVAVARKEVQILQENIIELKGADQETRQIVNAIRDALSELNKNMALLIQRFNDKG